MADLFLMFVMCYKNGKKKVKIYIGCSLLLLFYKLITTNKILLNDLSCFKTVLYLVVLKA